MNPDALEDESPGQTATCGDPGSGSGVMEDTQSLWYELRGLIHDRFRLAALEAEREGKSQFPATLRSLQPMPSGRRDTEKT